MSVVVPGFRTSEAHLVACLYKVEIQKLNRAIERRNAKIVALRNRIRALTAVIQERDMEPRYAPVPEVAQSAWQVGHDGVMVNGNGAAR